MGKRRLVIGGVAIVCGVIAACVGDDPNQTSGPVPDGGPSGNDAAMADTSPPSDANVDDGGGDRKNCGAPGHDCFGGDCVADVCQPVVIAQDQNRPLWIVADATHVFWVNGGTLTTNGAACDPAKSDGSIVRTKHDGSELVRITDGLACPFAITLGPDANVYFSTLGASTGTSSTIWRVSKDAPATTNPTPVYAGLPNVNSLHFDGATLYWADEGPTAAPGRIMRGMTDGGAPTVFAQGQSKYARYVRAEGTNLYWTSGYANELGNGVLRGAPKSAVADGGLDGGDTDLAGPLPYLQAMVTNATHAFYAYGGSSNPEYIESYAFGTGVRTKIFQPTVTLIGRGLAIDGTHVYLASRHNSMFRVELASTKAERFVSIAEACTGVTVDATSVFVTSTESGKVRRIRKPAD